MKKKHGLTMVYTGNGKGKTTAALGLALRAIGHDEKVYIMQFMKGNEGYGEVKSVRKFLPNITLVQSGLDRFVSKNPLPEDIKLAKEGINLAREVIISGEYDLVILDEINVAVDYNLLPEEEVLEVISKRPSHVTLVLTGRYAPKSFIDKADMVSVVEEVKHHYKAGIKAQPGIEH